ncbi:MAG: DUF1015 family protein [Chitinophagaceae bacterium]|jgi:uncharacterized protein (DUF1015 family)|nr:DUF1015 family protein [Chitinophagaceae bacterium]
MTHIAPFRALRPAPGFSEQVASPPYDVLNSEEARQAASGNPYSFLHVTKSEIDLPADVHPYSALVYEKARDTLKAMEQKGVLVRENKPCYYIYRLVMKKRSQTGLVCLSSVNDYNQGLVKKHEFTRPEKENDRINHIRTTGAQTGNVFLAYENVTEMDTLVSGWVSSHDPAYDFTAADAVRHTIWVVDDADVIESITGIFSSKVPCTYIADGHHRAASAAKVREALGDAAPPGADYFLTTLFPAGQLEIMDYNRVVKDLNGLSTEDFISALQDDFMITLSVEAVKPAQLHEFGMYLAGQWYILTARDGTWTEDPIGILDVSILSHNLLDKILDIRDQRTDKRIDFVGGIRGLAELEKRVDSGEMAVAFSLYPVSIRQLFDIADSGNVMPPKSTWFEPKLRDGLLTHLIKD